MTSAATFVRRDGGKDTNSDHMHTVNSNDAILFNITRQVAQLERSYVAQYEMHHTRSRRSVSTHSSSNKQKTRQGYGHKTYKALQSGQYHASSGTARSGGRRH